MDIGRRIASSRLQRKCTKFPGRALSTISGHSILITCCSAAKWAILKTVPDTLFIVPLCRLSIH